MTTKNETDELTDETTGEPGPRAGSLAVAGVVLGVALYLTYGLITMDVPDAADSPGPRFFPILVAGLAYLLVIALVVDAFRHRTRETPEPRTATDWKAVAGIVATLVVFTLLLRPLGWMLAGTLLFWGVATFLGSRRHVFDAGLALGVASIVQLIFSAGLGLNLPAGILGVF